jgi:hypothetical protein
MREGEKQTLVFNNPFDTNMAARVVVPENQ